MKFTLSVEFGNDAMQTVGDLTTVLQDLITALESRQSFTEVPELCHYQNILDLNGNVVGRWAFKA